MRSKIVLAVGIALMASACTKKAEGQTVAIVNGEEITAAELNAELGNAKIPEGADKNQARSRVLQAMIDRRLLAQQARKDGIDKTPEFLNRQRRATDEWLVNRALARGHVAEAVDFYLRFSLATLVRLVRVQHCPWRHDFGLRYLREDLPPDLADQVEELVPGVSTASLEELSMRCYAWIDRLLASPSSST